MKISTILKPLLENAVTYTPEFLSHQICAFEEAQNTGRGSLVNCTIGSRNGDVLSTSEVIRIDDYLIYRGDVMSKVRVSHQNNFLVFATDYIKAHRDGVNLFLWQSSCDERWFHISEFVPDVRGVEYVLKYQAVELDKSYYGENKWALEQHVKEFNEGYSLREDIVRVQNMDERANRHDAGIYRNEGDGLYFDIDNEEYIARACDTGDYDFIANLHYDDETGEWYRSARNIPRDPCEIINEYHCSPDPSHYVRQDSNDPMSKYLVGFEVEKNNVDGDFDEGDQVEVQPLFAGWETDSSCGVEGITHVYSLNNYETFESHVKRSRYTDEKANHSCGGHINFSDLTGTTEYWHIRPFLGLIWSLWRKRLNVEYSSGNKKASPYKRSDNRYSTLVEKTKPFGSIFELRLPNRIDHGGQLLNRFQLIRNLMKCVDDYKNERWISNNEESNYHGLPDWVSDEVLAQGIDESMIKLSSDLINKIPTTTFNRTYHMININKDVLMNMYGNSLALYSVVRLAYFFQAYIDLPEDRVYNVENQYILQEISQYL